MAIGKIIVQRSHKYFTVVLDYEKDRADQVSYKQDDEAINKLFQK